MTTQLANDLLGIGPAGDFPPLLIVLGKKRLVIVCSVEGKVTPPETVLVQYPRQGTPGAAEILEGGQLHGVSIQYLDFAALRFKGVIRMRTEQFSLPEETTIQVPGRTLACCHAFTTFAVILGNPTAGDGINEILVSSGSLMRLGRINYT